MIKKSDIRFNNRRRMAWISFWFMITVGGWMLIYGVTQEGAAERVGNLDFLLGSLFGMCTTIIISYFTSSTVTQMNDTRCGAVGDPLEGRDGNGGA